MKKIILLSLFVLSTFVGFSQTWSRTVLSTTTPTRINDGSTTPRIINVVNDTATTVFIKFYDKKTRPYSTDTPVLTIPVYSKTATINLSDFPLKFRYAMWMRQSKLAVASDTTINTYDPIVEITY